jgi:hypothetical protein
MHKIVKEAHENKSNLSRQKANSKYILKKKSVVLVRKRTVPIERSPPVSEASANFSG